MRQDWAKGWRGVAETGRSKRQKRERRCNAEAVFTYAGSPLLPTAPVPPPGGGQRSPPLLGIAVAFTVFRRDPVLPHAAKRSDALSARSSTAPFHSALRMTHRFGFSCPLRYALRNSTNQKFARWLIFEVSYASRRRAMLPLAPRLAQIGSHGFDRGCVAKAGNSNYSLFTIHHSL